MESKLRPLLLTLALLALSTLNPQLSTAQAQGMAFTYQGRLNSGGSPADGNYDMTFSLFNTNTGGSSIAGPVTNTAVGVTNGLFMVTVDFGAGVFTGSSRWLEIAVRTNGSGAFTALTPLQQVTPAPYAIYSANASSAATATTATTAGSAGSVSAANIVGTILTSQLPASVITNGASGVNISGAFTGDGSGLTNTPVNSTYSGAVFINRDRSVNFLKAYTAAQNKTGQLKIAVFGDSFQASTLAFPPSGGMIYGIEHYSQIPEIGETIYGPLLAATSFGTIVPADTYSWQQHVDASTSTNWIGFGTWNGNAWIGYPCDTIQIWYLTMPGYGSVDAYISSNNGTSYTKYTTVHTAGSFGCTYTNLSLGSGTYMMYLTNFTGRVVLPIYPHFFNSTMPGLDYLSLNQPGRPISDILPVNTNIVASILGTLQPHLISIDCVSASMAQYSNALIYLQQFTNILTNCDFCLVTAHALTNQPYSNIASQNIMLASFALSNNWMYFDAGFPNHDWNSAWNLGYAAPDGTHWNTNGAEFLGCSFMANIANPNAPISPASLLTLSNYVTGYTYFGQSIGIGVTPIGNLMTGYTPLAILAPTTTPAIELISHNASSFAQMEFAIAGGESFYLTARPGTYNASTFPGDGCFELLNQNGDFNNPIFIAFPNLGGSYGSGYIGIGCTNPQSLLDVRGTVTAQKFTGDGSGLTNVTAATLVIPPGMALIPAGAFTMGDTLDGESDAIPTNVYVSAFYMDVNLVSFAQWLSVYYWATNNGYRFVYVGAGKAANHPVQTVDWYDSLKWCNARSQQAGRTPVYYTDAGFTQLYTNGDSGTTVYPNWAANGYRLPTEAEWEKAARGGLSGQRFPWGNVISENLANYTGNTGYSFDLGPSGYNSAFATGEYPYTSPVGYFAANGYGLYDMAGNVWQWCWDWYGTPYGQPTTTNPTGAATGGYRVLRCGNWSGDANVARCAHRDVSNPNYANIDFGIRCVRGL